MDGWTDRQTDRKPVLWIGIHIIYIYINKLTHKYMNGRTDGQMLLTGQNK